MKTTVELTYDELFLLEMAVDEVLWKLDVNSPSYKRYHILNEMLYAKRKSFGSNPHEEKTEGEWILNKDDNPECPFCHHSFTYWGNFCGNCGKDERRYRMEDKIKRAVADEFKYRASQGRLNYSMEEVIYIVNEVIDEVFWENGDISQDQLYQLDMQMGVIKGDLKCLTEKVNKLSALDKGIF